MSEYSDLLEQLWRIRERRRALAAEDKHLAAEFRQLEYKAIAMLSDDGTGLRSVKTDIVRATVSKNTFVQVRDKSEFIDYVFETNKRHLANINPNSTACKESFEILQAPVPGVQLIETPTLLLRTVKTPI